MSSGKLSYISRAVTVKLRPSTDVYLPRPRLLLFRRLRSGGQEPLTPFIWTICQPGASNPPSLFLGYISDISSRRISARDRKFCIIKGILNHRVSCRLCGASAPLSFLAIPLRRRLELSTPACCFSSAAGPVAPPPPSKAGRVVVCPCLLPGRCCVAPSLVVVGTGPPAGGVGSDRRRRPLGSDVGVWRRY